MYFEAEKLVAFCATNKVTVGQFLLCYLTHTEQFKLLYQYSTEVTKFSPTLIADLEKKRIITNLNRDKEGFPDNLLISDKFRDKLSIFLGEEADELFEAFPTQLSMGGKVFSGRTISPEDLELVYHKKLMRSKSTHAEVMSALEEQKDNGTVGMGLKKWFETEQWKREDHSIDITNDL